ncbi:MAG TPA: alpha/beta fold hydrolase, partial [Acidimicrobiia bacterium]
MLSHPLRSSRRARTTLVGSLALITALAACTSSAKATAPAKATRTTTSSTATPVCRRPSPGPVVAVPVPGVASDSTITSFDGTHIRAHWFPLHPTATQPVPTVLTGPGWGSGGDTNTTSSGSQGFATIKDLHAGGYNVLTWDPRGFGQSNGTIEVDSAQTEARDVGRLIDWVATLPGVELDAKGDPRVGMVGESYGGGIQLVTAAVDCRVDAIVPSWAWNSLSTSLDKAATVKTGWSSFLYGIASMRDLDPHIVSANRSGIATGVLDAADQEWFAQRGPGALVNRIRVPTLLVQGTVDTLFTLDEAVSNYRILRSHGVPTAMVWFCGGHGVCLTPPGDRDLVERKTMLWLARYL